MKILLVDDDKDIVFLFKKVLEKSHQITVCETAKDTLENLSKDTFDLLILDLVLPDMDGADLLKKIRENSAWKKLYILVLSAHAMKEVEDKVIKLGANKFVAKPISLDKLKNLVNELSS